MKRMHEIGFKPNMYVYSMSAGTNPSSVKVAIPEVSPDITGGNPKDTPVSNSSLSIFVNENKPKVSGSNNFRNYITLPVPSSVKLGTVSKGSKLIAIFMNANPEHGYIIAKV